MQSLAALAIGFVILISAAACGQSEVEESPPAPSATVATSTGGAVSPAAPAVDAPAVVPSSPGSAAIAVADGESPGVRIEVTELKRTSGGTLSLRMTLVNESTTAFSIGYNLGASEMSTIDFASVGGVYLVDPVGKKKYFVVRDTENHCLCSRGLKDLQPGGTLNLWARFPAPPEGVEKIGIVIPKFVPIDDVPLS